MFSWTSSSWDLLLWVLNCTQRPEFLSQPSPSGTKIACSSRESICDRIQSRRHWLLSCRSSSSSSIERYLPISSSTSVMPTLQ